MKVSVIIPVYNEEKYIDQCIKSLFIQTLKPFEIIVVDDGSTDNSILKFKIKNLLLLQQKHKGPAIARNYGAKKASGDILVFVDADMKFDHKYLEKLIKPIREGEAQATFTKEEYVANPDNVWSKCWNINSGLPLNLRINPNMSDKANNFRAIKKNIFNKTAGYQNVGYGEDVTVLAQLKGIKADVARGAICYHYNPSTLVEVFFSARWIGRGETINRNVKSFLTYLLPNSLRKGIIDSLRSKTPLFLIFKIVFDFGVLIGLFDRSLGGKHTK